MIKKVSYIALLLFVLYTQANCQSVYNPSLHLTVGKPFGAYGNNSIDARSEYYVDTSYTYRPYVDTSEVNHYLQPDMIREGMFKIFVSSGDSTLIWWYRNGTADSDLTRYDPSGDLHYLKSQADLLFLPYSDTSSMLSPYTKKGSNISQFSNDVGYYKPADTTSTLGTKYYINSQGFLKGNQTITLSGDVTGTGTTAIPVTLANTGVTAGGFTRGVVNAKGLITSATDTAYQVAGSYALTNGSNATGTWPISVTGTASSLSAILSSTLGGSGVNNAGTLTWGAGGTLGSNAYTSTAYLPLTGGTLTGALTGTLGNFTRVSASDSIILTNTGGGVIHTTNAATTFFEGQGNAQFVWRNDALGSYTQTMLLNTFGNLAVGNITPITRLDVNGDITDRNLLSAPFVATNSSGTFTAAAYTPYNPASYPVNAGGETLQSVTTRNNSTTNIIHITSSAGSYPGPGLTLSYQSSAATVQGYDGTSLSYRPIAIIGGTTGANLNQLYIDNTGFLFKDKNGITQTIIDSIGQVTATKFITSGGTSSQFVKGDGSLDGTAYTPLTGAGATGTWSINITGNAATATNSNELGGLTSSGFIRNNTVQQASSNFNISGNGTVGGYLESNGGSLIYNSGTYVFQTWEQTNNSSWTLRVANADSIFRLIRNNSNGISTDLYDWNFNGNYSNAGTITASGFYNSSDTTLKNIYKWLPSKDSIQPIYFSWKSDPLKLKHWGYAAQQVAKVLPDAVIKGEDGKLKVDYNEVQTYKIAELEKENKKLSNKVDKLQDEVNRLMLYIKSKK